MEVVWLTTVPGRPNVFKGLRETLDDAEASELAARGWVRVVTPPPASAAVEPERNAMRKPAKKRVVSAAKTTTTKKPRKKSK